jgi:ABC-type nitrate/sulfonate/bicarbonate transport system permease component
MSAQPVFDAPAPPRRTSRLLGGLTDRHRLLGLSGVVAGIAIWIVVTSFGLVPDYALAGPGAIAERFAAESEFLLENIWLSFVRVVAGFTLGSLLGIGGAIAASWVETIDVLSEPTLQLLKPVPPLVLTPFMVIWFGAEQAAVIALATWGTFFVMVVEGREALRRTPIVYRWAAATLGETNLGVNVRVMLPSSLPRLIGALRISLVVAVNLVILGEFSVASGGLGDLIVRGYRFLRPDQLLFGIIVAVAMTALLDGVIRLASRRVRRWA